MSCIELFYWWKLSHACCLWSRTLFLLKGRKRKARELLGGDDITTCYEPAFLEHSSLLEEGRGIRAV